MIIKKITYSQYGIDVVNCRCGHCSKEIGMPVHATYHVAGSELIAYVTGNCPICKKPIIYCVSDDFILPAFREFDNVNHLPKNIEKVFNECRDTYSANAFTAVTTLARTLIAHVAVEQGAEENKNFTYYVDFLAKNFFPASLSKPWIDKVRTLGNNAVHKLVLSSKEEATLSLKFISAILKNVYEYPNSI